MFIFRLGNNIFVSSVNPNLIKDISGFDLFNLMTGSNLASFTLFALGLSPFITGSIIIELLSEDVVPAFTRWKKENDTKKRTTASNTCGLILAFLQAAGITFMMDKQYGILRADNIYSYLYTIVLLVAGSCVLLWLSKQVDTYGIGNGSSIIIASGILYNMPTTICNVYDYIVTYKDWTTFVSFGLLMLAFLSVVFFVVYIEKSERVIKTHYFQSSHSVSGQHENNLAIKVNVAGVIPVIFASSILQTPTIVCSLLGKTPEFLKYLSLTHPVGITLYALMIVGFVYFYSKIMIDAKTINQNFVKTGCSIVSVRPGEDTITYINTILNRVCFYGSIALLIIALIPILLPMVWETANTSLTIGGTSLIIVTGVTLDIVKKIKQELTKVKYVSKKSLFR